MSHPLASSIRDERQLEDLLSEPTERLVQTLAQLDGDVIVLGAGGKMGPTLARMARRADDLAGTRRRVIAVSRFRSGDTAGRLESHGVETIRGDLLEASFVRSLPRFANVVFMAGRKFGASSDPPLTWATNSHLPSLIGDHFDDSRIAVFSTGNVYPLVDAAGAGSVESDPPRPVGEYAMSCLGRERVFQYLSRARGTPLALLRLNYACELRYGVLVDVAQRVFAGAPVELTAPCVNVIWQGDASAIALCSLADAEMGGRVVNLTGPEKLRVRDVAEQFGKLFGRPVRFTGREGGLALLSNAQATLQQYGTPRVSANQLLHWIADWITRGGATLGKPTHFESSDGQF